MYGEEKPQTRRNGKLQSCEPCRRSKLRCDHARPVCQRCSARSISQHCFYHPSPMTKSAGIYRDRREPNNRQATGISSSLETAQLPASEGSALEVSSGTPGYLGSTSYSAVLMEHQSDVSLDISDLPDADNAMQIVNHDRIQSGVNVLALWYNLPLCAAFVERYYQYDRFNRLDKAIGKLMLTSIQQIFDTFGAKESKLESCLQKFSQQIFYNSSQPLKCHQSMTVQEYAGSFSGRNCRWETLGLLFAIVGQSLLAVADNDPLMVEFAENSGAKERILTQIIEASSMCIAFCDHAASPNEILAWAQYQDLLFRTQQYGDASYQVWRRLGDLSATIYAAGLHKVDGPQDKDCPFFVKQLRRLCFGGAFAIDKDTATFVGRPPLINYRHCSLILPLDLTDELFTDKTTMDAALAELDATGWSRSKNMTKRRPALIRQKMILALFREEVLELALGDYQQDVPKKSERILERARAAWDACPDYLKYNPLVEIDKSLPQSTYTHFFVMYLDYLYSEFLLYRTLVKHSDSGRALVFDTARQLVAAVNKIFASRDKSLNHGATHSWIIMYYGVPSASSLAFELLQQTRNAGPHAVTLPRAEVIRNLSIFISCLNWAALPSHGNYRMCKEAEQKLSHVVDQILDPPASSPENVTLIDYVATDLGAFLDWNPTFVDWIKWDFNNTGISS